MAAAVVNRLCTPTAQALKQAGLEYLLFDEAQAQAILGSECDAADKPEAVDVQAADKPKSANVRTVVSREPSATRATREPVRDMRQTRDSRALPQETAPNPADWPANWQERLKKTRVAPVVWTYWELGRDLSGAPDPKRRDLLQDLLKDLAHPPGTHSFWPLALPASDEEGEQELTANAPVFWEGVRLLHSRAVVVMGSQARDSLALPDSMRELRPFRQVRYQGRQLILLHSPDILIQEPQRIQALQEFLRQALAPFAVH